jgi:hypothetical protein
MAKMKKLIGAMFALPLLVAAGSVSAQPADDIIMDDEAAAAYYDDAAPMPEQRPARTVIRTREAPAVYGWTYRIPDCGVYHYWNGDTCVDARDTPPNLD